MTLVRSLLPYPAFIAARVVINALHREDGADGYIVGEVSDVRADDEEITQDEYDTEAQTIRDYNAAIPKSPEPPPPPDRDADLETALEGATTIVAMKTALLDWVKKR